MIKPSPPNQLFFPPKKIKIKNPKRKKLKENCTKRRRKNAQSDLESNVENENEHDTNKNATYPYRIKWDDELIYKMVKTYFQRLEQSITYDEFEYWFDMTGLQRHLKAIGIFSRLYYRDKKSSYLKDIPNTLNYIVELCTKYPELHEFQILVKQIKSQGKL